MHTTPTTLIRRTYFGDESPLNTSFSNLSQAVPRIIWDNNSHSPLSLKPDEFNLQNNNKDDIDEISKMFDNKNIESSQAEILSCYRTNETAEYFKTNNPCPKKVIKKRNDKLFKLKEQADLYLEKIQKNQINVSDHSESKKIDSSINLSLWDDINGEDEDLEFFSNDEIVSTLTQITSDFYDEDLRKFKTPPPRQKNELKPCQKLYNDIQNNIVNVEMPPILSTNKSCHSPIFNLNGVVSKAKLDLMAHATCRGEINVRKHPNIKMTESNLSPIIPLIIPTSIHYSDPHKARQPLSSIDPNTGSPRSLTSSNYNKKGCQKVLACNVPHTNVHKTIDKKNSYDKGKPTINTVLGHSRFENLLYEKNVDSNYCSFGSNSSNDKSNGRFIDNGYMDETSGTYLPEEVILALTQDDDSFFD